MARSATMTMTALLLLTLPAAARTAATASTDLDVVGIGQDTCAAWLADHRARDARSRLQDQWLGGFLTGFNAFVADAGRGGPFFPTELNTVPSAISNFCRNNRDKTIAEAANGFVRVFRAKSF